MMWNDDIWRHNNDIMTDILDFSRVLSEKKRIKFVENFNKISILLIFSLCFIIVLTADRFARKCSTLFYLSLRSFLYVLLIPLNVFR